MSDDEKVNPRRLNRDPISWPGDHFEYSSMEDFLDSSQFSTGVHTIYEQGEIIDFHYSNNKANKLAVFFHGAVPAKKIENLVLPIFSGSQIELGEKVDRLLFSDSTMAAHKNLRLGWFSGTAAFNFAAAIDAILAKLTGVKMFERVVLIGGSQGAFAALRASYFLKDSVALVWNPQIQIEHFFIRTHLDGFLKYCFNVTDYQKLPKSIHQDRNFDLAALYAGKSSYNYVFLMQNLEDIKHVEGHTKPFAEALGYPADNLRLGINRFSDRVICALGDWRGGHSRPDRTTLECMAQLIFTSKSPLKDIFLDPDLEKKIPASFLSNQGDNYNKNTAMTGVQGMAPNNEINTIKTAMKESGRSWYVQYGRSNLVYQAARLAFDNITVVSDNQARSVKLRKELDGQIVKGRSTVQSMYADLDDTQHSAELQGLAWPKYIVKPWRNTPSNRKLPDVVVVNGPLFVPICLFINLRSHLYQQEDFPKLFIRKFEANKRSHEILMKYFTEVECVNGMLRFIPKKDVEASEILNELLLQIQRTV